MQYSYLKEMHKKCHVFLIMKMYETHQISDTARKCAVNVMSPKPKNVATGHVKFLIYTTGNVTCP